MAKEERLKQLVTLIRETSERADQDVFVKQDITEIGTLSRRHRWNTDAIFQGQMSTDH